MRYFDPKQLHNWTLEIKDFVLHMFNYTQNGRILSTHHVFEINKGIVHSYNFDLFVLERGPHNESSNSSKSIRAKQKRYPCFQEQANRERRSRKPTENIHVSQSTHPLIPIFTISSQFLWRFPVKKEQVIRGQFDEGHITGKKATTRKQILTETGSQNWEFTWLRRQCSTATFADTVQEGE